MFQQNFNQKWYPTSNIQHPTLTKHPTNNYGTKSQGQTNKSNFL